MTLNERNEAKRRPFGNLKSSTAQLRFINTMRCYYCYCYINQVIFVFYFPIHVIIYLSIWKLRLICYNIPFGFCMTKLVIYNVNFNNNKFSSSPSFNPNFQHILQRTSLRNKIIVTAPIKEYFKLFNYAVPIAVH